MLSIVLIKVDQVLGTGGYEAYSPKCVEGEFCELRLYGVLRSSRTSLSRCQMDDTFAIYLSLLGYLVAGRLWWG
jgi:hypothetical protein